MCRQRYDDAGTSAVSACSCRSALSVHVLLQHPASHHQVRWAGFSLKQHAWLNITNQRRAYKEQPLLLYALASNSGVLPAGRQLQLPGFASFGCNSSEQSAPLAWHAGCSSHQQSSCAASGATPTSPTLLQQLLP